jgi:vacuolar-type H+-ATPase subunit H
MSTESERLEIRMKTAEAALEEVKKSISALKLSIENHRVVGPRGPAGDISAAVHSAEQVARDVLADAKKHFEPTVQEMTNVLRQIQEDNRDGLAAADEKIESTVAKFQKLFDKRFEYLEHEVAAYVLPLLHEYGLLKDGSPNADYFRSEFEPASHKKLEKRIEPRKQ